MLWQGLKPDWNFSYTLLLTRNVCNRVRTTFSRTLDMKGSLEIGLKLERRGGIKILLHNRIFKGSWATTIEETGIYQWHPSLSKTSLRRQAWMLSEGHCVGRRWWTTSDRQEIDIGSIRVKSFNTVSESALVRETESKVLVQVDLKRVISLSALRTSHPSKLESTVSLKTAENCHKVWQLITRGSMQEEKTWPQSKGP